MYRATAVIAVFVFGGAYFGGALGGSDWTRTVGKPQSDVMNALATLDIRDGPGAPGTDPNRSGGFPQMFRMERDANEMRWRVMSGDKVATTMIADFKPIGNGQETEITAHVERGDAPDDFVAPAFRSQRITLGLFSMAMEGKLTDLTNPKTADAATCAKLAEHFRESNEAAGLDRRTNGLSEAMGRTASVVMRLQAYDSERQRLGCRDGEGPFDTPPTVQSQPYYPPTPPIQPEHIRVYESR